MKLIFGNCLEVMKEIPGKSIDMILCDLPYGTTNCKWDVVIPFEPLWELYKNIIKPNGAIVLFGSEPFSSRLIVSNLKMFKYDWVWEKSKGSNFQHSKYQPLKVHETISIFSQYPAAQNHSDKNMKYVPQMIPGKEYIGFNNPIGSIETMSKGNVEKTWTKKGALRFPRSVQYFKTAESEGKLHPTQKPVALLEYLIKAYTNESETVLDNCMGSGSTGIACVNTGRNFIGVENDEKYFNVAKNRLLGITHD